MTASRPARHAPVHDAAAIYDRLVVATQSWQHLFRHHELGALSQIVAAAAPSLDLDGQVALAKLGAWICAFDDFADDASIETAIVEWRVAEYGQLITRHECQQLAEDPLARFLVEVLDEMALRHGARALWSVFATQMLAALDGMLWERVARRVSLGEYLSHASESVFVKPVITAAAILLEDEHVQSCIQPLLAAQRHAAVAIRIANDRATRGREQMEGATNVFVCSPNEVHALDERMSDELNALVPVLMDLQSCPTAEFLAVFTTKMLEMYGAGQLR